MKIVKVKITRWGISKLECIKAIKNLMGFTLREAKDVIENSEMPCVFKVYDNEKLKVFKDYTQTNIPSMNYTVEDCNEDSDRDTDAANLKTMSITDLVEGFAGAINNAHEAFNALVSQNEAIDYIKSRLEAEVKRLKFNNNNDLCIQLREEIACLKRDNGVLKESNNTFVETIRDQEKQIRDLEKENNTLREGKKVVETNNDSLMIANKSLREDVQRLNEILQAIKNLTL